MTWSWYYLIPLAFMLIIAVIWLIVFFMSYKNGKNVKSAVNDAKEVIEAFKGDVMARIIVSSKPVEKEEVTETLEIDPVQEVTKAAVAAKTSVPIQKVKTDREKTEEFIDSLSDEQAKKLFNMLKIIIYG